MSLRNPHLLRLMAVAVSTASASVAQAQSLEEIVVTASRGEQRVFDSSASLSLINEEALDRATAPTLADVLRDVPGLQVSDSGQPGLARIRLRGEESRRTAILVNNQDVTDHHEVGTPLTLHPSMIERIEVVRGSGAVLYGSRALSGVVNFFTRKGGTEPLQASFSAGHNSATSGSDLFASVFGNVEGLEYRLAYSESDHGERNTPEGEMENTAFDNKNGYLYAGYGLGDHRFEYTYENYQSASNVYVEEEVKTSFPLTDFYIDVPQRDREKHGFFYAWEPDSDWLDSITANGFHQVSDRHFYTYTETVWYLRDINTRDELTSNGALLQFNFRPLGQHEVIAGLQYVDDEVDQTRNVDTVSWTPFAVTGSELINDLAEIETWALFAQDQWQVSEAVSLTAGLRQYFVTGELRDSDRESLETGELADDDELIGALGLVWEYSDNIRLRANVSEGYVYPSLMQLATGAYAGSSYVNPNSQLSPETSVNYETGLRLQTGSTVVDATLFYTESEDYIHHLPCTPADQCPGARDRTYLNIGESRAHGVELYLAQGLGTGAFEAYSNLTWMQRENEYADFSTWDSGIPQLSGRLGLRWEGTLLSMPSSWADFYLRGESDSSLKEPGSSRDVLEDKTGWATLNLAMGLSFGGEGQHQLTLNLLNLADKSYIPSTENLYGAERSLQAKLTFNW
ncbi:TonB-dependent receptor plug domain-containing protein [Seongchinamella sediminis]|nr:TonB-dependent receptor [Seongchinamella sediminis]